jgi:hypothetical protein
VSLDGGLFETAVENNIGYLQNSFTEDQVFHAYLKISLASP